MAKSASGTPGKRGKAASPKVDVIGPDKSSQVLPSRSALMQLAKGPKTLNNYSKAGANIVQQAASEDDK